MDQTIKIEMQCSTCSRARYDHKFNHGFPIYCNFDDKAKCDDDLCVQRRRGKMTPEEFAKLPAAKRRQIAEAVYREMLKTENGPTKHCFGCGDDFPVRTFCEINDNGDELCERCIFVLALYTQQGIKKRITAGNLNPHMLNSHFRKIVEEDFYLNQKAAYEKHLGDMIRAEEAKQRIIWIAADEIRKIAADFPFYLMTDAEVRQFNPTEGEELTLRTNAAAAGQPDTIRRRIYAIRRIPARAARKYTGSPDRRNVCFIPEVYDR